VGQRSIGASSRQANSRAKSTGTRVHRPLPVEEALPAGDAEQAVVPDVRMDVEAPAGVEAEADEADEALRRDVVAAQSIAADMWRTLSKGRPRAPGPSNPGRCPSPRKRSAAQAVGSGDGGIAAAGSASSTQTCGERDTGPRSAE